MRAFLGWLRGEADHCSMAAIPTLAEEDGKRPTRERESRVNARSRLVNRMKAACGGESAASIRNCARRPKSSRNCAPGAGEPLPPNTLVESRCDTAQLRFVADQIKQIEKAREARLEKAPREGAHPMVLMLASIKGVGLETAEMLVAEVLSRKLRDRRAVARYGGLTGSPDESRLAKSREGIGAVGQCARAARHDPTGLAVFDVPEGKRAGQMVRGAHRQWTARGAQDDDRRAGAQVVDRLVALRRGRDRAGRRRVVRTPGREPEHRTPGLDRNLGFPRSLLKRSFFFPRRARIRSSGATIRGGGALYPAMAFVPRERMVPPPRNYAADAHECIMGSARKARRIQGCGAMIGRPRHSSPRDFRLAEPMAAPRAPDIIVRSRNWHERRASSSVENPPE